MISRIWWVVVATFSLVGAMPAKRHTVAIAQFQFKPVELRAAVGDTIVWDNRDIVPHTARANNNAWDTGHIDAKAKHVMIVRKKGVHEFTCLYHSNMKGKLIVK